jgi:hypothetical protein
MQKLVRAYDSLFKLGESFRELKLLDIGEWARRRGRSPDMRGGLEELHVCKF